jgi:hypothetical protein
MWKKMLTDAKILKWIAICKYFVTDCEFPKLANDIPKQLI